MRVKVEKIFWGVFLILAAAFLVVSQMGFFPGVSVVRIFFAILCVAWLIKGIVKIEFGSILFPLAFLGILFDHELGITAITPWTILLAALLGSIGLDMIFSRGFRKNHRKVHVETGMHGESWEQTVEGNFNKVENAPDGEQISFKSSFGAAVKYINSECFQYADLSSKFGAMKVYFDNAVPADGHATIDLDVSFAGVELFVPKSWTVVIQPNVSFGAVNEKNRNMSTGTPVVTITGHVNFSGVEITYV